MRGITWIPLMACTSALAQWDVPARVQLNGVTEADRQVTGLAAPVAPEDGVSAGTVRRQTATYGLGTGVDQIDLQLAPAPSAYVIGMQLSFEPETANSGAATLNVNGLGAVPIVKFASTALDSADLQAGVPVNVIYDGTSFQLLSQMHPACPPGYTAATRDVCVEITSHPPMTYYAANEYCVTHGARLCTFGEWYHGCSRAGGFLPTVAAYEWVDEAANNNNYAKRVGTDDSMLIGCELGSLAIPTGNSRVRCCYDR